MIISATGIRSKTTADLQGKERERKENKQRREKGGRKRQKVGAGGSDGLRNWLVGHGHMHSLYKTFSLRQYFLNYGNYFIGLGG